jgi:hypothetical protein
VAGDPNSSLNSTESIMSTAALKNEEQLLERKIGLAVDGFTAKYCELTLKDRSKLSKENALVVAEYIIAIKREVNSRYNTIRTTIEFLSLLSRSTGLKHFRDMTREDILSYLDQSRKPENEDPLHKWIGGSTTWLFRETSVL